MTGIYLVRHGRPCSGWGDPELDPGLDAAGQAQAQGAAAALRVAPDAPSRLISSPLRRSRETAAAAAALSLPVEIEGACGELPTRIELRQSARGKWLAEAMAGAWEDVRGDLDYDSWRRSVAGFVAGCPGAAIFSHFVAINAVVSTILDVRDVVVFRPAYASITALALTGGRLQLRWLGAESPTEVA